MEGSRDYYFIDVLHTPIAKTLTNYNNRVFFPVREIVNKFTQKNQKQGGSYVEPVDHSDSNCIATDNGMCHAG